MCRWVRVLVLRMMTAMLPLMTVMVHAADEQVAPTPARSGNLSPLDNRSVPSLDELAAAWMEVKSLRNFPSVNSFLGALKTTTNLTAFEFLAFPPYSEAGGAGELQLEGQSLPSHESRWLPYEVQRRTTREGVTLESAIRLSAGEQTVLVRLSLTNQTSAPRTLNLALQCGGRVRCFPPDAWRNWGSPRPSDTNFTASASPDRRAITVADKTSPVVLAYAFARVPESVEVGGDQALARWRMTLAPGTSTALDYTVAVSGDAASAVALGGRVASDFEAQFAGAKAEREEHWRAMFRSANQLFSGHLPTLVTDDARLRRVYYHSALVPLMLCRTNLPASRRSFVTVSPQWGVTLMYFWDTEMWANAWAMIEPATMRELLSQWLGMDLHACFALDCVSGQGAGPWYAANDWAVFRCVEAYLNVTGDAQFLRREIKGRTVMQHLERIATAYESRVLTNSPLADYGGADNLLECAPNYIHRVPSFNAGNVYLLRRTADFLAASGQKKRASELRHQAAKLLPAVLDLYEPGQGVWNTLQRDGTKAQLRHCFDYILIGQALENDLTAPMKSEMTAFVERELLTRTWMRAMSLRDPAAENSDRPDHGPFGSYDGWPALTMDVMCRFGAFDTAIAFLRSTETVTHEGPFAQSHEFLGPDLRGHDPIVRIANRGGQDFNEGCGAAFMETIIRSFFGFRPELFRDIPRLLAPKTPRGFAGQLLHVPCHGALYAITSDAQGLRIKRETP